MDLDLNTIIGIWVPLGFGLIGIVIFLAGAIKLISGKDGAFSNMMSGIFVVLIAIALRFILEWMLVWLKI